MESKECLECGKKLIGKTKHILSNGEICYYLKPYTTFCNRKCFAKHRKTPKGKCIVCKADIEKSQKRQRLHCSFKCKNITTTNARITHICEFCNKEFTSGSGKPKQMYCSYKCKTYKYHPIIQAEFWRDVFSSTEYTTNTSKNRYLIPNNIIPKGVVKDFHRSKWTQQEIKEFKEWNQKNV